jgi:putative transposase
MKKKQLPSQKIHEEVSTLLHHPFAAEDLLGDLQRSASRLIAQQALEEEAREHLGRDWYRHRQKGDPHRGHRNGYERRIVKTELGRMTLRQPRLRGTLTPFRSRLATCLGRLGCRLVRLSTELYVRGLSVRDIEETLIDETGKPLLSRSATSRLSEKLYQEYEAFTKRDLSELDVVYLFVDGVYESVRRYTNNQTILCAWAILSNGRKEMLHLAAVESESTIAWEQFFQEMLDRGVRQPLVVISDGAKGLHQAIARCFPKADRQRCIAHKMRNLTAKLPQEEAIRKAVLERLRAVYYAPDRAAADVAASAIVDEYSRVYPAMVECFMDDLDACLTHLAYPMGHRKFIRTTNQLERSFLEEKRRTKVMPQHANERGALKLVFGVLIRVSAKWVRVRMSKLELTQLRNLRNLKAPQQDKNYISYRLAA